MGDLVSRPSRLGLALAATVAFSSLTFGGGIAFAVPGPDSAECKTAEGKVATAQAAANGDPADETLKTELATAKSDAETACTAPPKPNPADDSTAGSGNETETRTEQQTRPDEQDRPETNTPDGNERDRRGGPGGGQERREQVGRDHSGVAQGVLGKNPKDVNCRDFKTQPSAQAYYDAYPGDPARLDRDKDGKACESLADLRGAKIAQVSDKDLDKTADDESEVEGDQVSEVPEGSVDTGGYDR